MGDGMTETDNQQISAQAATLPLHGVGRAKMLVLSAIIVALLASVPLSARAGLLADFKNALRGTADAASLSQESVQSMPLPRPAMNIDPNPAKGGGEVRIKDESVVLAGGFLGETVTPQQGKDAISIYVVREDDTLSEIADMFGVSVNTIIWANDIRGPIKPGQMLTILPTSGVRYTVKKGDTLASIAKEFKGVAEEIAQFNGLSGELAVGDSIIIPNGQEFVEPAPVKTASASAPSKPSPSYAGYYTNPLPGGTRTQGIHGTNGVDLAVPNAARPPIVAAAAGEVIIALEGGWNGGYGSYVVIRHDNGSQTLYAHMSSVSVGKGQYVNQGQVIGYVGNTGRSSGPHLHFEIRGGGRNPF